MNSSHPLYIESNLTQGRPLKDLLAGAGFLELLDLTNPDLLVLLRSSDPVILALLSRGPFCRERVKRTGILVEEMRVRVLKIDGRRHSRNARKYAYRDKEASYGTCRERIQLAVQSAALLQRLDPTLQGLDALRPWHVAALYAWAAVRGLKHKTFNRMGTFWRDALIVLGHDPKAFLPPRNEAILERLGMTDRYVPGSEYRGFAQIGQSPEEMISLFGREDPRMGATLKLGRVLALRPREMVGFRPLEDFDPLTGRTCICHMTKGGRRRFGDAAPDQDAVRAAVEAARPFANPVTGSLIPQGYSRRQWLRRLRRVGEKLGYTRHDRGVTLYSLRHQAAHEVYEDETGMPPPVVGGVSPPAEADARGRKRTTRHLGHGKLSTSDAYLGAGKHRHRDEPAQGTRPTVAERKRLRGPFVRRRRTPRAR